MLNACMIVAVIDRKKHHCIQMSVYRVPFVLFGDIDLMFQLGRTAMIMIMCLNKPGCSIFITRTESVGDRRYNHSVVTLYA